MKDVRPALRAVMLANSSLATMVTESGEDRIYPGVVPQGETRPSIVYNLISEDEAYHMQGGSGLIAQRIQVDCWALSQALAITLANLVFDSLSGFKNVVAYGNDSPQQSVDIKGVFHNSGVDETDTSVQPFRYNRRRDYIVWFKY